MTRFIHDQFAKDYLEELLSPYGDVQAPRRVAGEVRQIDVWFAPALPLTSDLATLGLLGRFAASTALFEPFRNAATANEICDCLLKLLEVRGEWQRDANRNNRNLQESALPNLWILTPTASAPLLSGFGANQKEDWLCGIHFLPAYLRTAIVAIHQLPRTSETLWLRVLGRGKVQKQAIDELQSLPADNAFRGIALELPYSLRRDLQVTQEPDEDDRELIMRLVPLLQQEKEQARQEGIQQGLQQGQRLVLENLLRFRYGSIGEELAAIVEPFLALPSEQFNQLLIELSTLSREELLARFKQQS